MWDSILSAAVSSGAQAVVGAAASTLNRPSGGSGGSSNGGYNAYSNAMANSASNALIPASTRPKQKQVSTPAPTVSAPRQSNHPLSAWTSAFRGDE